MAGQYEPTIREGTIKDHRGMPEGTVRVMTVKDGKIVKSKVESISPGEKGLMDATGVQEIARGFGANWQRYALWGALGLGGYALFRFLRR